MTRSFVARLFVPLWVCVGLLLALLVGAAEATAAAPGHGDDAPSFARSRSSRASAALLAASDRANEPSVLRRDAREPSPVTEVGSDPEDENTFETPTAAFAPLLVPSSSACGLLPSSVHVGDTGLLLVSTGLGRGPPSCRR